VLEDVPPELQIYKLLHCLNTTDLRLERKGKGAKGCMKGTKLKDMKIRRQ
jgi:hypothetical protein